MIHPLGSFPDVTINMLHPKKATIKKGYFKKATFQKAPQLTLNWMDNRWIWITEYKCKKWPVISNISAIVIIFCVYYERFIELKIKISGMLNGNIIKLIRYVPNLYRLRDQIFFIKHLSKDLKVGKRFAN